MILYRVKSDSSPNIDKTRKAVFLSCINTGTIGFFIANSNIRFMVILADCFHSFESIGFGETNR